MLESILKIRTRYSETDQMGYVYYGHYLAYFELGRTETIRQLGFTYKDLETNHGVMLPVAHAEINYKKPAFYDDLLTIKTQMKELPTTKITFVSEIFNEQGELIADGLVILVFVNKSNMRPCRPPKVFLDALEKLDLLN